MRVSAAFNPYVLILPGLLVSGLIILWPLAQLSILSVSEVNRFGQVQGFAGGANYALVFVDPELYASLWRTVIWTVGVVGGTFVIALPISLALNEEFYGRGLARVLIMLPWAMSLTMTRHRRALGAERRKRHAESGAAAMGLIDSEHPMAGRADTAFPMQMLIGIIATVPFTSTIFLGGLSSIPDDLYEAARMEGATPLQQFREITFPLLRPFINIAIVLNTIYVFNSFPIIWVMTQGGPANSTDILVTHLYKLAFRIGKLGEARRCRC